MDKNINNFKKEILIIGKSGVGKSSFINYILGSNECDVGDGKPVTSKGIYRKEFGKDYYLYDTWGLEADKYDEWKRLLEKVLENEDNKQFEIIFKEHIDYPLKGFFDSIFYCLSAQSGRVEEKELAVIKWIHDKKENPIIILTKCDIAGEEKINGIINELKNKIGNNLKIVKIGKGEETFSGESLPFGKDEIEKMLYLVYIERLVNYVPRYIVKKVSKSLKKDKYSLLSKIEESLTVEQYNDEIKKIFGQKLINYIEIATNQYFNNYNFENILNIKNVNFSNDSILSKIMTTVETLGIIRSITRLSLTSGLVAMGLNYLNKNQLKEKLISDLNEKFNKIEKELENFENILREEIILTAKSIICCAECNSKLKVSFNKKNKCPKCGTIHNISEIYNI